MCFKSVLIKNDKKWNLGNKQTPLSDVKISLVPGLALHINITLMYLNVTYLPEEKNISSYFIHNLVIRATKTQFNNKIEFGAVNRKLCAYRYTFRWLIVFICKYTNMLIVHVVVKKRYLLVAKPYQYRYLGNCHFF